MMQPRSEDLKIVVLPVRPPRPPAAERDGPVAPPGRILPFTGVRCERFPDEASFVAALAALGAEPGHVST